MANKQLRMYLALSGCVAMAALSAALPGAIGAAARPPVQDTGHACLPTCAMDARFLVVTGNDPATLLAPQLVIGLTFPLSGGPAGVEFDLFDGDADEARWDVKSPATNTAAPQLELALSVDPAGTGVPGTPLKTWAAGDIPFVSSDWTGVTVPHDKGALTPEGPGQQYRYVLKISAANPTKDMGWNVFKVRSRGTLDLPRQVVGFMASMTVPGDVPSMYPNYPALTGSPYDGTWTFKFRVPAGQQDVTIFDGDMDYGDAACALKDTDDRDSSGIPDFGLGAVAEGIASAGAPCKSGRGTQTGVPEEDHGSPAFRRVPKLVRAGIAYRLVAPDGQVFLNRNPSGNREWEQFKIVKVAGPVKDACPAAGFLTHDCETTTLPEGVWEIQVDGMDVLNLNFLYFNFRVER